VKGINFGKLNQFFDTTRKNANVKSKFKDMANIKDDVKRSKSDKELPVSQLFLQALKNESILQQRPLVPSIRKTSPKINEKLKSNPQK